MPDRTPPSPGLDRTFELESVLDTTLDHDGLDISLTDYGTTDEETVSETESELDVTLEEADTMQRKFRSDCEDMYIDLLSKKYLNDGASTPIPQELECVYCNKTDHELSQCPDIQMFCKRCEGPGHYYRKCPVPFRNLTPSQQDQCRKAEARRAKKLEDVIKGQENSCDCKGACSCIVRVAEIQPTDGETRLPDDLDIPVLDYIDLEKPYVRIDRDWAIQARDIDMEALRIARTRMPEDYVQFRHREFSVLNPVFEGYTQKELQIIISNLCTFEDFTPEVRQNQYRLGLIYVDYTKLVTAPRSACLEALNMSVEYGLAQIMRLRLDRVHAPLVPRWTKRVKNEERDVTELLQYQSALKQE